MSKIEVISEHPIMMAELKEELQRVKERDGELNFRAGKTQDHLNLFVGINSAEAKELKDKINALAVPRLKPEHIVKIVDQLPATDGEVKAVLQGYPLTVTADNIKKIADTVKEYAEKNSKEMKKIDVEFSQRMKKEEEQRVREAAKAAEEAKKEVAKKEAEADGEGSDKGKRADSGNPAEEMTETGADEDAE